MKRSVMEMIHEFLRFKNNYIFQSLFAVLAIFVLLLALKLEHPVKIASIGSSAFIVFAMPNSITAEPKRIIGGHITGIVSGSLCFLIPHATVFESALVYALAVGISIFSMVIFDKEHPPASGTALGFAITGFSADAGIAVIASAVFLAAIHKIFRRHLRDLT